jgi:hypothetical protein
MIVPTEPKINDDINSCLQGSIFIQKSPAFSVTKCFFGSMQNAKCFVKKRKELHFIDL